MFTAAFALSALIGLLFGNPQILGGLAPSSRAVEPALTPNFWPNYSFRANPKLLYHRYFRPRVWFLKQSENGFEMSLDCTTSLTAE